MSSRSRCIKCVSIALRAQHGTGPTAMPPRERSCDGRVSIQLNAESGQAVIEKVVTQMHVLAPPVAKRCKLIQDLKLVHGSRAELPLRYGVVKGWEAFVHSDFQEPAAPSLDELAEWLRVASFFNDELSFSRIAALLARHVDGHVAAQPRYVAGVPLTDSVLKLSELTEHEAHAVLSHTAAPLLTLLGALPRALRDKAVVARQTDAHVLALPAVACSSRAAAQAALQALSLPLCRELAGIRSVDLSYNRLGPGAAAAALPLLLMRLMELRTLRLAGNDLGADGLRALTQSISNALLLEELDLRENGLAAAAAAELAEFLPSLRHLHSLDLSHNPVTADAAAPLAAAVAALTALRELRLRHAALASGSAAGLGELATALAALPALRLLDLSKNQLPAANVLDVLTRVAPAPALEELCIGGNRMPPRALRALAAALPPGAPLRVLHADGGGIADETEDGEVAPALPDTLRVLHLHNSPALVNDGTFVEFPLLSLRQDNLTALTALDVSGNVVSDAALCNVLRWTRDLAALDVSRCKSSTPHTGELADAVGSLARLTRLDAARAFRGVYGPWLPHLTACPALAHLDLSARGEHGASLAALPALTHLNLARSQLQRAGVDALANSLPGAAALAHLDVAACGVQPAALAHLLLMAAELPLECLDISGAGAPTRRRQALDGDVVGASLATCTRLRALTWHAAPPLALARLGLQLTALTRLRDVDLQGTQLSASLQSWSISWLGLLAGSLTSLNLKNTRLFGSGDPAYAAVLDELLRTDLLPTLAALTRLEALVLSGNDAAALTDAHGELLADALGGLRRLRVLKLRGLALSAATFAAVARRAVRRLLHLQTLDLAGCPAAGTAEMRVLDESLRGVLGLSWLLLDHGGKACARRVAEDEHSIVRVALGRCECKTCDCADKGRAAGGARRVNA